MNNILPAPSACKQAGPDWSTLSSAGFEPAGGPAEKAGGFCKIEFTGKKEQGA